MNHSTEKSLLDFTLFVISIRLAEWKLLKHF